MRNRDEYGYIGELLEELSEQEDIERSYFVRESCIFSFNMRVFSDGWRIKEMTEMKKSISTGYLHGYLVILRKEG